ncbi:hypothetical protein cgp_2660 [Corynebacterium glutamicum MB001]|nr:hypothetical protein cgp_2660 [Corynebacterium glutamicum MB001]ASW14769.1 hypothetical protein cgc1_2660 [Corynebacterium glutamicum]QYO74390.1 hypothetical protein cgisf_2660 [Corynebacterium glutamicum]
MLRNGMSKYVRVIGISFAGAEKLQKNKTARRDP